MKVDGHWIKRQVYRHFYDTLEERHVMVGFVTVFYDRSQTDEDSDFVITAEPQRVPEDVYDVQYAIGKAPKNWTGSELKPEDMEADIILHKEYVERLTSGRYRPLGEGQKT